MGNCVSTQDREAQLRSQEIDKQIEEDSRKLKKECKILLLGSGESGKSTIVKQVKIIHQNGFTTEELIAYKVSVVPYLLELVSSVVFRVGAVCMPKRRGEARWVLARRVCCEDQSTRTKEERRSARGWGDRGR